MKRHCWVLFGLLLVAGCRSDYSQNITVTPVDPKPGDTMRIRLDHVPAHHTWTVEFSGRAYPLFPSADGSVRTFIGLNAEWKAASASLTFHQDGHSGSVATGSVVISTRDFPFEELTLPKSKAELIEDPAHIKAKEKIALLLSSATPTAFWKGAFELPVAGRLNTVYGMRRRVNKKINWPYHKGLDLGAPNGTPVKAANSGRIVLEERFPIHGRTIMINHGQGVFTLYLHMSMFTAHLGEMVEKGQAIGKVGSDGFSTGPHLHWEFYVFGEPVNPDPWMEKDLELVEKSR